MPTKLRGRAAEKRCAAGSSPAVGMAEGQGLTRRKDGGMRAFSSIGESRRLITVRFRVRVPEGAPPGDP